MDDFEIPIIDEALEKISDEIAIITNGREDLQPCPFCNGEMTMICTSRTKEYIFSHKGLRNCAFYEFRMSWECAKSMAEARALWNRRGKQ